MRIEGFLKNKIESVSETCVRSMCVDILLSPHVLVPHTSHSCVPSSIALSIVHRESHMVEDLALGHSILMLHPLGQAVQNEQRYSVHQ